MRRCCFAIASMFAVNGASTALLCTKTSLFSDERVLCMSLYFFGWSLVLRKAGLTLAERVLVFGCWDAMEAMVVSAVRVPRLYWLPMMLSLSIVGGLADAFQVRPCIQLLCLCALSSCITVSWLLVSDGALVDCLDDDPSNELLDALVLGSVAISVP